MLLLLFSPVVWFSGWNGKIFFEESPDVCSRPDKVSKMISNPPGHRGRHANVSDNRLRGFEVPFFCHRLQFQLLQPPIVGQG